MDNFDKKHFAVDVRKLALGIFYILLIGVVFYGMNDHVYDGFGKSAPWVIIVLFAFMGIMRIVEGFTGKSVLEHIRGCFGTEEKQGENENE